ncbi:Pinin 1 [Sphaceloma murrayae]|uniref:DNA-binding protein RAP1 n=1 Tax=Sphaceloma murrayae TaxID=2082308 RepID=A0A2K1QJA7_9PEZI|nr:Pinin 1 [Sphaceloma murrayae]
MADSQLFCNKKFFLLQRVPCRSHFIKDVERHGGRVVPIEAQADYVVADHKRNDAPQGSVSWTFIEEAIRTMTLPDVEKYTRGSSTPATASTSRGFGGLSQPAKSTRTTFTPEDDALLYDWVKEFEASGGPVKGNEIYKQLAQKNPRHTYQSWRDRYIKYVSSRPPPTLARDGPPTPPSDITPAPAAPAVQNAQPGVSSTASQRIQKPVVTTEGSTEGSPASRYPHGFTDGDMELLIEEAEHIEKIRFADFDTAWESFAKAHGKTPEQWREFHIKFARPEWKRRIARNEEARNPLSSANGIPIDQLDGAATSTLGGNTTLPKSQAGQESNNAKARSSTEKRKLPWPESSRPSAVTTAEHAITRTRDQTPDAPVQTVWESTKRRRLESAEPPVDQKRQRLERDGHEKAPELQEAMAENHDNPTSEVVPLEGLQAPPSLSDSPAIPAQRGVTALTQKNLSQMQAAHRASRASRGKDIAEDDEDEDQGEYAGYLQSLLPRPAISPLPFSRIASPDKTPRQNLAQRPVVAIAGSSQGQSEGEEVEEDEDEDEDEEIGDEKDEIDSGFPSLDLASSPPVSRARPNLLPDDDSQVDSAEAARQLLEEEDKHKQSLARLQADQLLPEDSQTRPGGFIPRRTTGSRNAFADRTSSGSRNAFVQTTSGFRYPRQDHELYSSQLLDSDPLSEDLPGIDDEAEKTCVQLDLTEPAGGWTTYLSSATSEEPFASIEDAPEFEIAKKRPLNTQDVYMDIVADLPLDLPEPDFAVHDSPPPSDRTLRRRSDHFRNDSRSVSPIAPVTDANVEDYIRAKKEEGFEEADILTALHACSMNLRHDLPEITLGFLKRGLGIPKTTTDIWTEEHDQGLLSGGSSEFARLVKLHGSRGVAARRNYLAEYNKV